MIGGQSLLYKNPLEIQAGFCTGSVCAVLCCIAIDSAIIKFFIRIANQSTAQRFCRTLTFCAVMYIIINIVG